MERRTPSPRLRIFASLAACVLIFVAADATAAPKKNWLLEPSKWVSGKLGDGGTGYTPYKVRVPQSFVLDAASRNNSTSALYLAPTTGGAPVDWRTVDATAPQISVVQGPGSNELEAWVKSEAIGMKDYELQRHEPIDHGFIAAFRGKTGHAWWIVVSRRLGSDGRGATCNARQKDASLELGDDVGAALEKLCLSFDVG